MDSPADISFASTAVQAIHEGNLALLKQLLKENPGLATARIDGQRTLLHVATDWPGHFPNGGATVAALIAHGADVNAAFMGQHSETPLHWAASSDDVSALDALLDHGAQIEADGGVIGGGTPLADAVAFAQWQAARRLVERGARTTLWSSRVSRVDRRPPVTRSRTLSGQRAMAGSGPLPNIFSNAEPT